MLTHQALHDLEDDLARFSRHDRLLEHSISYLARIVDRGATIPTLDAADLYANLMDALYEIRPLRDRALHQRRANTRRNRSA